MKSLSSLQINESFIIEIKSLEKSLARKLISKGLIPNKKFKIHLKSFSGGLVIGDDYLKIALDSSIVNKLFVYNS